MGRYADDPAWADVVPLPTDEGGPHPLAAIAYSDDYEEVSSYMRAVMAANEYSERVLDLTEDLIDMNTAHYTAWLYRAKCLFALKKDLREEIAWLNETALAHQKNYQIWHHRNLIIDKLDDPAGETAFLDKMFELDAKNYHVWSYRQWLVRRFNLWDNELTFVERMLDLDVRNNSAWNHRWFIVSSNLSAQPAVAGANITVRGRELDYAKTAIRRAPQNQSPWNYLRGVVKHTNMDLADFEAFASEFADVDANVIRSCHALDMLADIWTISDPAKAGIALNLLTTTYDPIRKNYWLYKKAALSV